MNTWPIGSVVRHRQHPERWGITVRGEWRAPRGMSWVQWEDLPIPTTTNRFVLRFVAKSGPIERIKALEFHKAQRESLYVKDLP